MATFGGAGSGRRGAGSAARGDGRGDRGDRAAEGGREGRHDPGGSRQPLTGLCCRPGQGLQDGSHPCAPPEKVGWVRKFCGKGIFREIWKNRYVVLKGDQLYISEKEVGALRLPPLAPPVPVLSLHRGPACLRVPLPSPLPHFVQKQVQQFSWSLPLSHLQRKVTLYPENPSQNSKLSVHLI